MKKKKAGRPPVDDVSRSARLEIRLQESEKELYERAADLSGLAVSDWVRNILTEAAKTVVSQARLD